MLLNPDSIAAMEKYQYLEVAVCPVDNKVYLFPSNAEFNKYQ